MGAENKAADATNRADAMSPDQADIILRANYRNLVKKVGAGRTLSGGEVNMLQAIQNGGRPEAKAFATTGSEAVEFL